MTLDERLRLPCGICGKGRREHIGRVFGCPGGYGTTWNPEGSLYRRHFTESEIESSETEQPPSSSVNKEGK